MIREMTAHVMTPKPQIMTRLAGSHGYAPESNVRHASPPPIGTTTVVTRIIGTPNNAVTMTVRRGEDGMSAARIATIIDMPHSCNIDK